ncbi:MAG: GHKL domain-containing protein [Clostridia bacterium]|nr:GHKL domain-containing protein [Clostridia bacterium]
MEGAFELQKMVEASVFYQWIITSVISAIFFSFCDIYLFVKLFSVKVTKTKILKVVLLETTFRMIFALCIPIVIYRAIHIIVTVFIFKLCFKEKIERCILGEAINAISIISLELIFSKLFCLILPEVSTYISGMYNYKFKLCLTLSISISRLIICLVVKLKNVTIKMKNFMAKKNKIRVILISTIACMLILFNAIEMTLFITDFPYSIFIIDIISLILYFYISMKDIFRIAKLEEMDEKIHNLETYNKTLSIMYDNIRAFRYDFSNFVQALNGYAQINDVEGIKLMSESILKECKEVNNMGLLDPKIINNSAVYSIITNKYYLAQENNIAMNVEIMINFQELKISTYELCRILGILLDNAIEATKQCEEKVINVKFLKDFKVNRKLIIIENTFLQQDIDLEKIYEKGYTTKTDNLEKHGLGLWTVRKILSKSDNLNLFTTKDELFRQQLEIYE